MIFGLLATRIRVGCVANSTRPRGHGGDVVPRANRAASNLGPASRAPIEIKVERENKRPA